MFPTIARDVWEGKIPVSFELASYEVRSNAAPDPFYTMLPRNSYLTLFSKSVIDAFYHCIDDDDVDEVWFEYKEKPLRWHYPCGLLYDLFCDPSGSELPWKITVHFRNFPDKDVLECSSVDAIESHYISALKEADQLKHKGQVVCNMSKNQHQQLWHGLKTDNFEEFWQINKKFMDGFEDGPMFKSIPMRFYHDGQVFQRLVSPRTNDDSQDSTLRDALSLVLPSLFNGDVLSASTKILIHGISPPLTTSVQWLSKNLSYADNFLHVCVVSS